MDFDDICGFWNVPRMATKDLSLSDLQKIKLKVFLGEFLRIIKKGFRLRGFLFLLDFLKFVFRINGNRIQPLKHPYSLMELGQRKVDRLDFLNQRLNFFRRCSGQDIDLEQVSNLYEDSSSFLQS